MVWITIPNQKAKKTWVLNSFSPTPPKAGVQKYLRPSPTSGGTFALPSSGGHPGPGVNVLLMLFNFPANITKKCSGTKDFQIEDIAKIIPTLRVAKCKSSSKDQKSNKKPQHWDDLCNIFYLKIVFHAFGICRTHGVTNEYLLFENNLVELWIPSWNIMKYYLLCEKCFSLLLEYLLKKK